MAIDHSHIAQKVGGSWHYLPPADNECANDEGVEKARRAGPERLCFSSGGGVLRAVTMPEIVSAMR